MPERYESPALRSLPFVGREDVQIRGVDAKIYVSIMRSILTRVLKPGSRLDESVIAKAFHVRLIVARRVLAVLESEGAVCVSGSNTWFVASPPPGEAKEICEAVRLIGIHIGTQMCGTDLIVGGLEEALVNEHIKSQYCVEQQGNFLLARRYSGEFHILLAQIYGNAFLTYTYQSLIVRLALVITLYQTAPTQPGRAEFQQLLFEHIKMKNVETVSILLRSFYDSIEASLSFDVAPKTNDLTAIMANFDNGITTKWEQSGAVS